MSNSEKNNNKNNENTTKEQKTKLKPRDVSSIRPGIFLLNNNGGYKKN